MTVSAIWDRAWYPQTKNPRNISVSEALKLRDSGSLKSGDLFCCDGDCKIRLGARKPYVRRTSSGFTNVRGCFRRLPGARKIKSERSCNKHKKSENRGESWKHARVLSEITDYLYKRKDIQSVVDLGGLSSFKEDNDEADLLITHTNEIIEGSHEIRLICRFQNLRRANRVIDRHFPNIIFIDMHRWRDNDIEFIKYIHKLVDDEYQRLAKPERISKNDFIHKINYTYPNLGIYDAGGLGFGRRGTIVLDPQSETDEFKIIHDKYEQLLKSVEDHNYWAINEPGCQKYHLKYLDFAEIYGFKDYYPNGDNENEKMFPKSISIMMQENTLANFSHFAYLLTRDINFIYHGGKLLGDGQLGHTLELPLQDEVMDELGMDGSPIGYYEIVFLAGKLGDAKVEDPIEGPVFNSIDINRFTENHLELRIESVKSFHKLESTGEINGMRVLINDTNRYEFNGITKSINHKSLDRNEQDIYVAIPELIFWNDFDMEKKKLVFHKVKKYYRKFAQYRGRLTVMPLLDIELNSIPKTLVDKNKIFEFINHVDASEEKFILGSPLSTSEYFFLKWIILADKFYPTVNAPIIKEIIYQSKHSTDDLVTEITLEIPLNIEKLFHQTDNLDLDILDKLLSLNREEE
jgi:hypothetical protein